MGVTYSEFWYLNPKKLEAFAMAQEYKMRNENLLAWMSGIYIQRAIGSVLSKGVHYFKEPIDLCPKEESKNEVETAAVKFGAFAITFNHDFEERNSGTKGAGGHGS